MISILIAAPTHKLVAKDLNWQLVRRSSRSWHLNLEEEVEILPSRNELIADLYIENLIASERTTN